MSHRPVCVPCRCDMLPDKNGVAYIQTSNESVIWDADRWKCPKCGHMILAGFGKAPWSVPYHPERHTETLKRVALDPNTVTEDMGDD